MKPLKKLITLAMFMAIASSCTTMAQQPTPAERLIGTWNVNMQGQNMTLSYDGSNINAGQGMMIPYSMEGNQMTADIPNQGRQVFTISFTSDNEFVSTTEQGQETVFTRAPE